MLVRSHEIEDEKTIQADTCIVGAGPAGLTLARELAGARLDICVLESGGLAPELQTQSLARAANIGLPYYPLHANRQRAFGGTLRLWAGWSRPLDDIDFQRRSWVPGSGWPIDRAALVPYYKRAHRLLGLGEFNYDVEHWERVAGTGRIPFQRDIETRFYHLAERRKLAAESRAQMESAPNVRVVLGANATEIESNEYANCITGVTARSLEGRRFRVEARRYILATGGIENARLLLISNRIQSAGLGNAHDVVGRYFMEHLHFPLGVIRLDRPGDVAPSIYFRTGRPVTARLFLSPQAQEREGILHYNVMLEPNYPGLFDRSFLKVQSLAASLDSSAVANRLAAHLLRRYITPLMAIAYRQGIPGGDRPAPLVGLAHTQEQAPNPDSRVTLSTERDALGMNQVEMNWQTTDLDRRTAARGRVALGREFARAELGQMRLRRGEDESAWPPRPLQGLRGHHMGTTRMHANPREGVVDEHCRVHGVGNLYIAGSSVFPTAGAGTPTVTIIALAIRLADHLRASEG